MGCLLSAPLAEDGDARRPGGGAGGGGRGGGGRRARARRGGAQDAAPLGELDLAPPHWTAPASSKLRKPSDLAAARDEFWDTAPAYGGGEEIWCERASERASASGSSVCFLCGVRMRRCAKRVAFLPQSPPATTTRAPLIA